MRLLTCLALLGFQASPLDRLDRTAIPSEKRWEGMPDDVVGVLCEPIPYKDATNHRAVRVAFSPTESVLGVTSDRSVQLWSFAEHPARKTAVLPLSGYGEAWAFSPDGKTLAAAGEEPVVRLWDLTTTPPKERATLRPPSKGSMARDVAFAPDGKTLAVAHHEGTVRVWDLGSPQPRLRAELRGHASYLTRVQFSPDGKTLASGSRDKSVKLWDMTAAEPPERASLGGHLDNLMVVLFSPDGKSLASSGTEAVVRVWDAAGSTSIQLKGHKPYPNAVRGAAFLADGKRLASASADGQVILWDLATAKKIKEWTIPGKVHGMGSTPDGRHLAVVTETALVYILREK
jgi:WD40 repeat protein